MKLKAKLFWVVLISVIGGLIALHTVLNLIASFFNDGYAPNEIERIAVELQSQATDYPDRSASEIIHAVNDLYPNLLFDWFDLAGNLLFTTNSEVTSYSVSELLTRYANEPLSKENRSITFNLTLQDTSGYLVITALPGAVQSQFVLIHFNKISVFIVYLVPVLFFLFAPALAAVLLFVSVDRRIRRLNRAIQSTSLNQMNISLTDRSKDEIGQLTRLFIDMSTKIKQQFKEIQIVEDQRRKLVSNLSHNLRTPLTSIIGYADYLNRGLQRNSEEGRQWISIILSRSLYMEWLLKQLFHLSLSNRESFEPEKVNCDFFELVRMITVDYAPIIENKGIEMHIHIPDGECSLMLDSTQIEQCIRNLIDNSLAYGATGGYLGIHLELLDDVVTLSITDKGEGIPEDAQSHVFQRFYRSSAAKEIQVGTGLGLAIVEETVNAHGGSVRLYSKPHEVTTFTIELPLNKANLAAS
jgi:signal transduction histidine kinase